MINHAIETKVWLVSFFNNDEYHYIMLIWINSIVININV